MKTILHAGLDATYGQSPISKHWRFELCHDPDVWISVSENLEPIAPSTPEDQAVEIIKKQMEVEASRYLKQLRADADRKLALADKIYDALTDISLARQAERIQKQREASHAID